MAVQGLKLLTRIGKDDEHVTVYILAPYCQYMNFYVFVNCNLCCAVIVAIELYMLSELRV